MGIFACKTRGCKYKGLLRVSYDDNKCPWCGREMTFFSDLVPKTATEDGLSLRPEEEKDV